MSRVFVAGGAGGVGEGIVRAWLGEGATVVTTSRDANRRAALEAQAAELPGRLVARAGSASDPELLRRILGEDGPFQHVVASVGGGGWKLAPLTKIDPDMFRRVVDDGITAHWEVLRNLLPYLEPNGTYIFINGGAAREIVPGTGPLSLVARAQLALAEIARAEVGEAGPRITSFVLNTPIATRARAAQARAEWLDPDDVGRACVRFARSQSNAGEIVLGRKEDVDRI